ncbi:MAG: M48 family metalloprotease [Thermoproteota archaeon]
MLTRFFFVEKRLLLYNQSLDIPFLIPPWNFFYPPYPIVTHIGKPVFILPLNLLYIIGFALSSAYLIVMLTLGNIIVKRVFHVIELNPGEYEFLQKKVLELATKMRINKPKIGLVEDLRPNAFVTGYGEKTMLVFSLGLLNTLTKKELTAVIAHELSHIKNRDFIFKTLLTALSLFSFFNPFSYLSSVSAQKERESLADEESVKILSPGLLARAIIKINKAVTELPKEGFTIRLTSSLFLTSPISLRTLFSTHPKLEYRIKKIKEMNRMKSISKYDIVFSILLSIVVIAIGILAIYILAYIQTSFIRRYIPWMPFGTVSQRIFILKPSFHNMMNNTRLPGFLKHEKSSIDSLMLGRLVEIKKYLGPSSKMFPSQVIILTPYTLG